MEEKYLKTSWKQRLASVLVLLVMVLGSLSTYIFIIMTKGESPTETSNTKKEKLEEENRQIKFAEAAKKMSDKYFAEFVKYKKPKAFNAEVANSKGIQTADIKVGTGKELKKGDTEYFAYYIGYCPDESVFDSSFDSYDKPTRLHEPIKGQGLIAGWMEGVIGMKLGGVREIIMPGELAYGESRDDICKMKNAPLKFIVMAIDGTEYENSLK